MKVVKSFFIFAATGILHSTAVSAHATSDLPQTSVNFRDVTTHSDQVGHLKQALVSSNPVHLSPAENTFTDSLASKPQLDQGHHPAMPQTEADLPSSKVTAVSAVQSNQPAFSRTQAVQPSLAALQQGSTVVDGTSTAKLPHFSGFSAPGLKISEADLSTGLEKPQTLLLNTLAIHDTVLKTGEIRFNSEPKPWLQQLRRERPSHAQSSDASPEENTDLDEGRIDSELGELRIRNRIEDPELGILRIREQLTINPTEPPRPPIAYLTGRVGYISSDNIFLAIDEQAGIVGDDFFRYGLSLGFYPSLGPETLLLVKAETNLQRYTSIAEADYDDIRFRVGIRQKLFPRTYGEIAWGYQELFRPSFRESFFANHSFDLTLSRQDPLTDELVLSSYYRVQLNLSNPTSFDRAIQSIGTYASYAATPNLELGVNYQLTLADYTQIERYDTYHQLLGQLVYSITPTTRVSLFGGFSFGRSSNNTVRFEDTIFGVLLESSLALF